MNRVCRIVLAGLLLAIVAVPVVLAATASPALAVDTTSVLKTGKGSSCITAVEGLTSTQNLTLTGTTNAYVHFKCYRSADWTFEVPSAATDGNLIRTPGTGVNVGRANTAPDDTCGVCSARWEFTTAFDQDLYWEGFYSICRCRSGSVTFDAPYPNLGSWGNDAPSSSHPFSIGNNEIFANQSTWTGCGSQTTRVNWSTFGTEYPACRGSDPFDNRVNPCDNLSPEFTPSGTVALAAGETMTAVMTLGSGEPFDWAMPDESTVPATEFDGWRDMKLSYRFAETDPWIPVSFGLDVAPHAPTFTLIRQAPRNVSSASFEIQCIYNGDDFYYNPLEGGVATGDPTSDRGCTVIVVAWPRVVSRDGDGDYIMRFDVRMPAATDLEVDGLDVLFDDVGDPVDLEVTEVMDSDGTLNVDPWPMLGGDHYTFNFSDDGDEHDIAAAELRCHDDDGVLILRQTFVPFDPDGEGGDSPSLADCVGAGGIGIRPSSWVPGLVSMGACVVRVMVVPTPEFVSSWAADQRTVLSDTPPFSFAILLLEFGDDLGDEVASPSGDGCFDVGIPVAGVGSSEMCVGAGIDTDSTQRRVIALFIIVPMVLGMLSSGFMLLKKSPS